jgi:hypothetical protein
MPQLVDFKGRLHQFPDDLTQADIQTPLSSVSRAPSNLAEVPTADRRFPIIGGSASVRAPQPIRVQGPDGAIVEFPAGTSQETMTDALRRHYGGPAPQAIPPLPPGFKLDAPAVTPVPPLPPGFTVDKKPTFIPVEGDPFAQSAPARPGMFDELIPKNSAQSGMFDDLIPPQRGPQPKLIPVDHDPFAQPAPEREPTKIDAITIRSAPAHPSALHSLAVGTQGVGKGLTDIVTGPFDLAAGAQNLVTSAINKVFGTNIPYATPASKLVEKGVDALNIPVISSDEMSPGEKLGYNVNRFGTQALGTGALLATRAPAIAAATERAPTAAGRVLDNLSRPYAAAPARTLVGDTIGGAGAGVAVNAADNIPEHPVGGDWIKTTANVVAPLAGGVGANALQAGAEGLGGLVRNIATRTFTSAPREIPLNPNTKAPYSNADVDRAAAAMQAAATGAPRALAQDIRENAAALTRPAEEGASTVNVSALPTSGLLSRDPGLITLEQGSRTKRAADFIQRDQNVKEGAAERIQNARDPEADLSAVFRRAAEARDERLAVADSDILQKENASRAVDQTRQDQGGEFGAIANSDYKAGASRRLDRALVEENYIRARAEKNRQFETAPGRAEQLPADDVFAAIDRIRANANDLAPGTLPADFMRRLDALRPQMVDRETALVGADGRPLTVQENVGGPGTAPGGDLADLRKFIGPAREQAQRSGNFDLADNLGRLQRSINQTIEAAPGYAEANANYGQFAERFRPEPNDEMTKFTREIDRGGRNVEGDLNRGATPPSETAGRFLSSPETAATLPRALEGSPAAAAGRTALRDYLRSDFAMSALNADGTVNPIRASSWARNNADILAQFPAVRGEFDDLIATARRGQQMSAQARADLEAARAARSATEAEIDRSAIGTLLRKDPRDVASNLLGGGYGAEKKLDEINALVKNDEQARRGWKAAVAEVLADKVQGTRLVGETPEVQFARLAKEFKDNEALLTKTFSPEEMNNLRQAHTILGYFKEAEKRATVGSDTAEKWNVPGWAQLAVRHFKGDLAGGGLIKRFKLLLEQLPSNKQSADEIVHMAWFNPDVAAYLLDRPVKNSNVPQHNINLRRLTAAANAARESGDDQQKDQR